MVTYYILMKKKGAKVWRSAVKARKGVSLAKLRLMIRKNIKKGFVGRIVTESQLKRFMKSLTLKRRRSSRKRRGKR